MNSSDSQVSSARWWQPLIVFVIAFALRAAWLHETSVEHFDEGVYASNILFDASEGSAYPQRHLYAPPLLPWLIEWSVTFLGPGPWGTMFPSLLTGALTVALSFHVARSWFGPEAAWPTAIIAVFSEFHIIYSRAALTDVSMAFFCLLSVYLGTEAIRDRRWSLVVGAGVSCGLAWCTKYNGWLPLAILATAVAVWIVFHRRAAQPVRAVASVIVVSVIAGLVFAPVLWSLQDVGGYTAVAQNHRNYVVGLAGWVPSALQQFNAHRILDGWLSWVSLSAAALVCLGWQLRSGNFTWNQSREEFQLRAPLLLKLGLGAVLLGLLAAAGAGTTGVLLCCAAGGLAGRLRWPAIPVQSQQGSDDAAIAQWTLPCWVVTVWLGSLTVVTPLYRAYPRITVLWLIAVWLGAGAGVSWWVRANLRWHARAGTVRPVAQHNAALLALCVLAGYVGLRDGNFARSPAAWQPRNEIRRLAEAVLSDCIDDPDNTVVYTFGEPAVFYHLGSSGAMTGPVSSLPTTAPGGTTVLLIEGPHARATEGYDWTDVVRRYEKVKTFETRLSDLVLLNKYLAASFVGTAERPTETFHVWRLKSEVADE